MHHVFVVYWRFMARISSSRDCMWETSLCIIIARTFQGGREGSCSNPSLLCPSLCWHYLRSKSLSEERREGEAVACTPLFPALVCDAVIWEGRWGGVRGLLFNNSQGFSCEYILCHGVSLRPFSKVLWQNQCVQHVIWVEEVWEIGC